MRSTLRIHNFEKENSNDEGALTDKEGGRISHADGASDNSDMEASDVARKEWVRASPDSPRNWPTWKKWSIILGLNFYCVVIFIASTGFVTDAAEKQYGVGEEVSILGQSLYILGVAVGVCHFEPRKNLSVERNAMLTILYSRCSWLHCQKSTADSPFIRVGSSFLQSSKYPQLSRPTLPGL